MHAISELHALRSSAMSSSKALFSAAGSLMSIKSFDTTVSVAGTGYDEATAAPDDDDVWLLSRLGYFKKSESASFYGGLSSGGY